MAYLPDFRLTASIVLPNSFKSSFWFVRNSKDGKWSLPGGKLNLFEPARMAAERETLEEIGVQVYASHLLGIYQFRSEHGNMVFNTVYLGEIVHGTPRPACPNIAEVQAFSIYDLRKLNKQSKVRAGKANIDPVEHFLQGRKYPLDVIRSYF